MVEEKTKGQAPLYKGDGVAVWLNEKKGKKYLSIKVVGHDYIYAFPNEIKKVEQEVPKTVQEVNMHSVANMNGL